MKTHQASVWGIGAGLAVVLGFILTAGCNRGGQEASDGRPRVALVVLYEQGMVSRATPVIWEWLAFLSSVIWVFTQSIVLGKADSAQ